MRDPREPLVAISGLSIAFPAHGDEPVVQDIDLTLHPGECVALVGESGSGRSVTARSLLNLAGDGARITATQFRIGGRDARTFRETDWRRLRGTFTGLVMQDALVSLDPLRTVGQRQRVAIARALAAAPDLIGCDEPVSALDMNPGADPGPARRSAESPRHRPAVHLA